jgi:hypothetical protein
MAAFKVTRMLALCFIKLYTCFIFLFIFVLCVFSGDEEILAQDLGQAKNTRYH